MKTRILLRWLAVVAGITAICVSAFAQGGRGGGMRFGGDQSGFMLLTRKDVQDDLGVTAEQKAKIDALSAGMQEKMRAAFEDARNSGDMQGVREKMTKLMQDVQKEGEAILTEAQRKRLKEIRLQEQGNRSIADPAIQKELGFSDDQKKKVTELQARAEEANQAVMEKMRNGEIDRSQIREIMTKNSEALNAELGKVLTTDQAAKLKAMHGKPFKKAAPPPPPPPVGGR